MAYEFMMFFTNLKNTNECKQNIDLVQIQLNKFI